MEIGPYLGVGSASNDTEGFAGKGRGAYAFFGVKGGVYFMLGNRVELGLEAGYERFVHEQEYNILEDVPVASVAADTAKGRHGSVAYSGRGVRGDVTYSGSGAHVAGVLTVKF